MPLTCECEVNEYDDATWYYMRPDDYTTTPTDGRRRRCKSCGELIEQGALAARWDRERYPAPDSVEARIWGEEQPIPLAPYWHCEPCADQSFNLLELGFCVQPEEDVRALVREYANITAPRLDSRDRTEVERLREGNNER